MTSNDLSVYCLLDTGKWIEFDIAKYSTTASGFTYHKKFVIRIKGINPINLREIDEPHELRVAFDGNTHNLIRLSIDVVNKSHMPFYLDNLLSEIKLISEERKQFSIFNDPHLLKWSNYSLTHQIQPDIECNPNIIYRGGLVYSLPKGVKDGFLFHPDADIRVM